jgi:steroid delta-isomerase-like uncharacterized protein
MPTEHNRMIVRSFYEDGFNKGDLDSVRPYIAPRFVSHNPIIGNLLPGYEGYKQLVAIHRKAFPDIRMKIEEMIVNVDRVVVRWSWRGSHHGHFMGVPPSGLQVTVTGMHIFRIAHGKIAESWVNWDTYGLMQQIGHSPALMQPGHYSLN